MKKPTCIIIDDEPVARGIIERFLQDYPVFEVVSTFSSGIHAMQFLLTQQVDVMFLDINMAKMTGLEMLRKLNFKPLTVITTAHQEHAIESFELNVVDYLLKPFSFDRFVTASNRCLERINLEQKQINNDDFILIKQDKKFHRVQYSDILYIESVGDYVKFHLNEKTLISLQTMKILEANLPTSKFMRVHKSFIVTLDKITGFYGNVIEIKKEEIPIGESFRQKVKQFIESKIIE